MKKAADLLLFLVVNCYLNILEQCKPTGLNLSQHVTEHLWGASCDSSQLSAVLMLRLIGVWRVDFKELKDRGWDDLQFMSRFLLTDVSPCPHPQDVGQTLELVPPLTMTLFWAFVFILLRSFVRICRSENKQLQVSIFLFLCWETPPPPILQPASAQGRTVLQTLLSPPASCSYPRIHVKCSLSCPFPPPALI